MFSKYLKHAHSITRPLHNIRQRRRSRGQAIVELTLALTFLALLFAAAVDLGMAYKAYQTLINASAEASGYLKVRPLVGCQTTSSGCITTVAAAASRADSEARRRFRGEQGDQMGGGASSMDLDADGLNDMNQRSPNEWLTFIGQRVRINPADQRQVIQTGSEFAINGNFDPSVTEQACKDRARGWQDTEGFVYQCFLVIRSEIDYKPFAIAPFVGNKMTITAISVVPIIGTPIKIYED